MANTNGYKKRLLLTSASAVVMLCMSGPSPAAAQTPASTTAAAPPKATLDEVVVTARKRNEKELSVPVAITAFTGKTLKKRGIYTLQDLANHTPGLTVDNTLTTSGRSDRSFPEYVIRGMVPSITTNPTTTVFLDGAPIISGEVDSLENLQRVEVLKGPQSAYFGRETFAGAVSLITRDPSPAPQVTIDSLIGSPNWFDNTIGVEGPVIPDKLSISGSLRDYSRQGSYENKAVADKTKQYLGDQSTKSGNLKIVATPTPNLKVSVLGLYFHDDDGPSAQELIVPSQSNCLGFWFCGQVPDRLSNQPAQNDLVTPQIHNLLNLLGSPAGNQLFKPLKDSYGLARNAYHGSLNIDYYLPGFGATISSISAADDQRYSELQDLANDDGSIYPNYALFFPYANPSIANSYYDYPFFVEGAYRSLSQELRLTSDADQRFRWLAGFNYQYSRVDQTLGGGNGLDYFSGDSPDTSNTIGGFFGLAYDILPSLTVNFDGRLQTDKESTSPTGTATTISGSFTNFLPRVSVQYKWTPQIMSYVTYSEGVNPGTFNGNIPALPASEQAILENDYGAKVQVRPEQLTNYELGTKGAFFGDTLQISADVYYDIWYNQIDVNSVNFFNNGILENTTADTNAGKADVDGIEADTDWEPIRGLLLNASGAINNSSIVDGPCYTCYTAPAPLNVDGKALPDVSKFQLSIGGEYDGTFAFLSNTSLHALYDWGYFGRFDYTYKSPTYEASENLVYTPPENLLDLHAGVTHGPLTIEAFVNNLTNWGGPTALSGIVNLGNPLETYAHNNDALVGGLPYLRSYGLRLRYTFGL